MAIASDDRPSEHSNRLLMAALAYAARGWRVFPLHSLKSAGVCDCGRADCSSIAKHPWTRNGLKDATTLEATIRGWWMQWPRANVAIATGAVSGLLVIDVDPRHDGDKSLFALEMQHGELPTTHEALTGGGGRHLLFAHPGDVKLPNRTNLANLTGLDVRGDGGYIVAAPSLHASGALYAWGDDIEPVGVPEWLLPVLLKPPVVAPVPRPSDRPAADTPHDGRYWLDRALAVVRDGERNTRGFWLASQLRDDGVGQAQAEGVMRAYAAGVPNAGQGYHERDALNSLRSAYSYQRRQPARSQTVSQTAAPIPFPQQRRREQQQEEPRPSDDDSAWEDAPPDETDDGDTPPTGQKSYTLTEFGNAERLLDAHGADMRYCGAFGWVIWNGRHWHGADAEMTIREWAKDVVRALRTEAAELAREAAQAGEADADALTQSASDLLKWATASHKDKMIAAMLSLAKSAVVIVPAVFDREPMLFNCANGTIDLRTGQMRPHRREDYLMQCSPTVYDPNAHAPTFDRFVKQIMCDRPDLVNYLQRALGYSVTGDVSEQVWHLLVGEGENGKGTLIEAVSAVLGEYAGLLEPESITASNNVRDPNAPSPEMAGLKGKRLVKITETEEGARIAPARIKRLSGGDELKGRHLRRDDFRFMPTFKLWLYTNHRPQARETTHAFWRRVRFIPFDYNLREHPEAKDKALPQKLSAEAPGILAWLIRGALAWQRDGLTPPAIVLEATEAYKRDSDLLQMFLDENVSASQGSTPASAIYGRYTTWCEEYGERPMSQRRLGESLAERGYQRSHMRTGWFWLNLHLTDRE